VIQLQPVHIVREVLWRVGIGEIEQVEFAAREEVRVAHAALRHHAQQNNRS